MNVFEALREFEDTFNPDRTVGLTRKNLDLRKSLISEEVRETFIEMEYNIDLVSKERLSKELVDILYVVLGAGVMLDLPLEEVFRRTHLSNMTKVGDDGLPLHREDGKVLKGPNYKAPNLKDLFDG